MKVMYTQKQITEQKRKLGLLCCKCDGEKAIIVDKTLPTVRVKVGMKKGEVVTEPCYQSHLHHSYCYYHLNENKYLKGGNERG